MKKGQSHETRTGQYIDKKKICTCQKVLFVFIHLPVTLVHCSGFGCSRKQKRHAAAPPPTVVQRRMERNRQKLVGRDKGSLTEQQTEGTGITTVQKRGIHKTNQQNRAHRTEPLSRTKSPLCPPEPRVIFYRAAPRTGTQ